VCQGLAPRCATMFAVKRVFNVRLYPTAAQERALDHALHETRRLYNALLQQRRDAYRLRGVSVTSKMQYGEITALRRDHPGLRSVYRELEDAALHRLDLAMQAFFRRVKRGETPGFPRYRSARRWRQLEFPHGDRALKFDGGQRRVYVPGIGKVKLRKGRAVPETYGRAWLVRKGDRWYAQFECEVSATPLPATGRAVGLDRGVRVLVAASDGRLHQNPRFLERTRCRVERLQRAIAKRKRGSQRQKKARAVLARLHERLAAARRDHAHKLARTIVNEHDLIALEALRVTAMTRSAKGTIENPGLNVRGKAGLNRAMLDAAFGQIANLIVEKAESAVRQVIFVETRFTSQQCSRCQYTDAASRNGECFSCSGCGYEDHADVNAARNILRRAELQPAARRAPVGNAQDPRSGLSPGADSRLTQHDAA
jgi:putative transposase